MHLIWILIKAVAFFVLGIVIWIAGTVFHGLMWWSLGLPEVPFFLPFANLMFLPFAFWIAWQLVLNPRGLRCEHCRDTHRFRLHVRVTPDPGSPVS